MRRMAKNTSSVKSRTRSKPCGGCGEKRGLSSQPKDVQDWVRSVRRIFTDSIRYAQKFIRTSKDEEEIREFRVSIENNKKFLKELDAIWK